MKSLYFWILLGALLTSPFRGSGQVRVHFTPQYGGGNISGYLPDWQSGEQSMMLFVNNTSAAGTMDLYLEVQVGGQSLGRHLMLPGIAVPQGVSTIDAAQLEAPIYRLLSGQQPNGAYSKNYLNFVLQTQRLPGGEWEFTAELVSQGSVVVAGIPRNITITEFQAPSLIRPVEGVVMSAQKPFQLLWSPPGPLLSRSPRVNLRVYVIEPGQSPVQAAESNLPVIDREIVGVSQYYLTPADMQIMPGDSQHFVWYVVPEMENDIARQDNAGASALGDFWIKDDSRPIDTVVRCPGIDLGPDIVLPEGNTQAVSIGCAPSTNCAYLWGSDKANFYATRPRISVNPQVSTRYGLYQTDTATGCTAYNDIWVVIEGEFKLSIQADHCGNLHAVPIALKRTAQHRRTASGADFLDSDGYIPGTVVIIYGIPYDQYGNALIPTPPDTCDCYKVLPNADRAMPWGPFRYQWSTGDTTSTIHPGQSGHYACTVTKGDAQSSERVAHVASNKFQDGYPTVIVPKKMQPDNPEKVFQMVSGKPQHDDQPPFNATAFRLTIDGKNGYHRVIEGNTTSGFTGQEIVWDGGPSPDGIKARPGKYEFQISFTNCDHPVHDEESVYRIRRVKTSDKASNTMTGGTKGNSGTFKVKRAKRTPKIKSA